jgi:DNA-binding transcriptional LysR family regulator
VQSRPLLAETVYLATPGADAGISAPEIADFADAPWIAGTPGSVCHALVIRACQASGFSPRIRHHADDFVTVLVLINAGQGVSLVPELGLARVPSGVTLTPLTIRRRTRVAWRAGTGGHPAIAAFTAAVSDSCHTEPSAAASPASAS